jgi:hypothetical protein
LWLLIAATAITTATMLIDYSSISLIFHDLN